ncbi:hypothetical protein B7463_g9681, partial [Scytalidium lignicola]
MNNPLLPSGLSPNNEYIPPDEVVEWDVDRSSLNPNFIGGTSGILFNTQASSVTLQDALLNIPSTDIDLSSNPLMGIRPSMEYCIPFNYSAAQVPLESWDPSVILSNIDSNTLPLLVDATTSLENGDYIYSGN